MKPGLPPLAAMRPNAARLSQRTRRTTKAHEDCQIVLEITKDTKGLGDWRNGMIGSVGRCPTPRQGEVLPAPPARLADVPVRRRGNQASKPPNFQSPLLATDNAFHRPYLSRACRAFCGRGRFGTSRLHALFSVFCSLGRKAPLCVFVERTPLSLQRRFRWRRAFVLGCGFAGGVRG